MAYIDPVQVAPDNYKVILENDHVRVLEMNLKAGHSDEMHSHPSETAYFLKGSKVRVHLPDGGTVELEPPDGFVMWHEEWTHKVENIGNSDLRAIVIEAK